MLRVGAIKMMGKFVHSKQMNISRVVEFGSVVKAEKKFCTGLPELGAVNQVNTSESNKVNTEFGSVVKAEKKFCTGLPELGGVNQVNTSASNKVNTEFGSVVKKFCTGLPELGAINQVNTSESNKVNTDEVFRFYVPKRPPSEVELKAQAYLLKQRIELAAIEAKRAEEEAKKAEEAAKIKAEEEAKKAEEAAKIKAEEDAKKAKEESKRLEKESTAKLRKERFHRAEEILKERMVYHKLRELGITDLENIDLDKDFIWDLMTEYSKFQREGKWWYRVYKFVKRNDLVYKAMNMGLGIYYGQTYISQKKFGE